MQSLGVGFRVWDSWEVEHVVTALRCNFAAFFSKMVEL